MLIPHRPILLLVVAAAMLPLVYCETTGDPTKGGIFWSESKAQARQGALQSELNAVRGETSHEMQRRAALEKQY